MRLRYQQGMRRPALLALPQAGRVLRWVAEGDLPELHDALVALGLAQPGAGTIVDVTACPGTDTCKLGISSSRGLASGLSVSQLVSNSPPISRRSSG